MRERNAWCRLDAHGKIEELVRVVDIPGGQSKYGGKLVVCSRNLLENYASITDTVLFRMFDITRMNEQKFSGWTESENRERRMKGDDIQYDIHIEKGRASFIRGYQVVSSPHLQIPDAAQENPPTVLPQFAEFVALDWKNMCVTECSCEPASLSSYFELDSTLPFETTVAFFDPEVLARFKADREVYKITELTISCRGTWSLERYHVNDAGQVFTYLIYLSRLPTAEQQYWRVFNRSPIPGVVPAEQSVQSKYQTLRSRQQEILRRNLSERVFSLDFEGDFSTDLGPLQHLKGFLQSLDCAWWKPRHSDVIGNVQYPNVGSNDDWRREILNLDHLIVEGLDSRWLRRVAQDRGHDVKGISVNQILKKCLISSGVDLEVAEEIVNPFVELRQHRNILMGHPEQQKAARLKEEVFEEYGGYRESFFALVDRCKDSMTRVSMAFASID